jgi:mitochondrial fission process protein 1
MNQIGMAQRAAQSVSLRQNACPPSSFRPSLYIASPPTLSRTGPRASSQKNSSGSSSSDKEEGNDKGIKVNLFENAGTSEDRSASGWEPFSSSKQQKDIVEETTTGPLSALLSTVDFSEPMSFDGQEKTEYDPLRDGPLRYLGYANELGEAFAAWLFPGGVTLSYAVAIGYVLFDTVDKYNKTLKDAEEKLTTRSLPSSVDVSKLVATIGAERGLDTLVWQLIASVAAPGYTIHTVVALVTSLLATIEEQPAVIAVLRHAAEAVGTSPEIFIETFNKSGPTAAGLIAIPFIVHPIDGAVHALLNGTLRPAMRNYICKEAGGKDAGLEVCKNCK